MGVREIELAFLCLARCRRCRPHNPQPNHHLLNLHVDAKENLHAMMKGRPLLNLKHQLTNGGTQ